MFKKLIINPILNLKRTFKLCIRIQNEKCIYAIASGTNQKCGLAVMRLSGKNSLKILSSLTKTNEDQFEPRKMYLKSLQHPVTGGKIDKALVVWFKGEKSFTGEDCCEFHVHGGSAVLTSLMNALASFPDTKYAEPGEFSKRAFLNGRMDLGILKILNINLKYLVKLCYYE